MARISASRKKLTVLGITAILTIAGAGIAFAYWTSGGTGTGSAQTGDSVAFEITAMAPVGTIEPGSAGQTVAFTVTNAGEGTQNLTGVTVAMANAAGVAWAPTGGCLLADYAATITTAPTTGVMLAGATRNGTVTVTLADAGVNQDACKRAKLHLRYTARR